ncbi:MAG: hypothetical protein JW936_08050 [Sedimentisphaerales bacterium]|nr:hypothetical protein [Sedimentisphaerales bacterium]
MTVIKPSHSTRSRRPAASQQQPATPSPAAQSLAQILNQANPWARGVIYSEVLGQPVGLRSNAGPLPGCGN